MHSGYILVDHKWQTTVLYGIPQVLAFSFLSESINISVSNLTQEIKQYSMTPITSVFWKWSGEQEEQHMALQRPQRHKHKVCFVYYNTKDHAQLRPCYPTLLPTAFQGFNATIYRNTGHRSSPESKDLPYMLQYDCSLPHHWNDLGDDWPRIFTIMPFMTYGSLALLIWIL